MSITEKDFKDFPKSDTSKVPILDRSTAEKIGDRYLGSLTDKVSQYVAADTYTQLTVDGKPYRVTPLEYADPIKWFNNQSKGIGEYIKVDMVTGNAELVDLKTPMSIQTLSILTETSNAIFGLSTQPRFLKRPPLRWMMKAIPSM